MTVMGVRRQILGLLGWMAVATYLYVSTLTLKPLWTDEFATIAFSLGRSFNVIPIDQLINSADLLAPLQIAPPSNWSIVLQRLLTEDTHPPIFFWLNYEWMQAGARILPQWFITRSLWPSVFAVRSLAAVFGILCVPAMFIFGWVSSRSWRVAQLAAGLMAVSPFGLFLGQEARHYSLAALWVILSLTCGMAVVQAWQQRLKPSWCLCFAWIVVNGLGLATHYFFALILMVEAMLLLLLIVMDMRLVNQSKSFVARGFSFWLPVAVAAIGTGLNGLIWVIVWRSINRSELIQWVYTGAQTGWLAWVNPIVNLLVGGMTMVTLWPIQGVPRAVAIVGGVLTLIGAIVIGTMTIRGLRKQWQGRDRLPIWAAIGSLAGAMVSLLYLDYGGGADVTRGFRFNFLYLPSVLLLVAWGLAGNVKSISRYRLGSSMAIALGLVGSLSVGHNLAYQKVHQPTPIVDAIVQLEQVVAPGLTDNSAKPPVLIMAPFRTHAQTTRLMSLAWDLQQRDRTAQFYLDRQQCPKDNPAACKQLTPRAQQMLQTQMPEPFRLWLINYNPMAATPPIGCQVDRSVGERSVDGFTAQPYRCKP
jgi:uncharacterized membrane protein